MLLIILLAFVCARTPAQDGVGGMSTGSFRTVDVYLDSKNEPLAAYQLEFWVAGGSAKIVGIEGGAHAAFAEPPFYDPQAMQHERVAIAAFNTSPAADLPAGRTRVATIHFLLSTGDQAPRYALKLQTAGTFGGQKIKTIATFEERQAR